MTALIFGSFSCLLTFHSLDSNFENRFLLRQQPFHHWAELPWWGNTQFRCNISNFHISQRESVWERSKLLLCNQHGTSRSIRHKWETHIGSNKKKQTTDLLPAFFQALVYVCPPLRLVASASAHHWCPSCSLTGEETEDSTIFCSKWTGISNFLNHI